MNAAIASLVETNAVFIVPYAFALNPTMLFVGVTNPMQVILIVITSLIGIFGVSSALEGYMFARMNPIQRIFSTAGGILLIDPTLITDVVGIAIIAAVLVWQILQKGMTNKKKATAV